jgi:hypothetical protein
MIGATNIGTSLVYRTDKKGKKEEVTRYNPIGLVNDFLDPNEADNSKFSM